MTFRGWAVLLLVFLAAGAGAGAGMQFSNGPSVTQAYHEGYDQGHDDGVYASFKSASDMGLCRWATKACDQPKVLK